MPEIDLALGPEPGWQALWQQLAALAVVALATAWLTVRWLTRRRGACGGTCSRCTHACENSPQGAPGSTIPGAFSHSEPPRGVRPAGLRVVQTGSPAPKTPADPPRSKPLPGA